MEVAVSGPGAFAVNVVGVSQYQRVLEAAAGEGALVDAVLVLEDDNAYDDQAVAVHIEGARAGYLSRADARLYRADLAAAGEPELRVRCKARIVGGFETASGERAHFGLKLDLPRLSAP
jgi:hypothetical protein